MTDTSGEIRMMAHTALFVALIAAGAFTAIPVGPVPIVLQNMFVLLAGLLLGPRWGIAGVAAYLFIGVCGLPVFAGGTGGIGRVFGPTGGYLLGYLPAVAIAGFISRRGGNTMAADIAAMTAGTVVIYAAGAPWLKAVTGMGWSKTFFLGVLPFIPGDTLKIAGGAFIAKVLRPLVKPETRKPD